MRSKLLKNLQIKKKLKRLGALGLCALLIAGNLAIPDVAKAASPDVTYTVPDSGVIENVLTYFQYFTSGDLTLGNHTMGAVAVGGKLNGNGSTFGDAAKTASYANVITNVIVPDAKPIFHGVCNDVYYSSSENMDTNQLVGFVKNDDYINMSSMFSSIQTESDELAKAENGAKVFSVDDIYIPGNTTSKVLDVDFSNSPAKYTIPYEVFAQLDRINIKYDGISDLLSNQCVISIIGMGEKTGETYELIGGGRAAQTGYADGENKVAITFNGSTDRVLFDYASGVNERNDGQYFLGGMKLIFNLPDYEGTLKTELFSGHIVAPNATVIPSGGTLEGGVIAKTIYGVRGDDSQSAQAHYYPYSENLEDHYSCPKGTGGEVVTCDDIILTKQYINSTDGNAVSNELLPPKGYGAKFSLYQADGTTLVNENLKDIEAEAYEGQYRIVISGEYLQEENTYILKETVPAHGFEASGTEYYCHVDHKGDVVYNTSNDNFQEGRLVCKNVISDEVGTLVVTVKEAGKETKISGVEVTVKVGDNEADYRTGTTDESGTVTFNNMPAAENYKVIIDDDISGYKAYENEVSGQKVLAEDTTNVIFELEKEAVQQPETGTITITVMDTVSGQLFKNFGPVTISGNGIAESSIDTDPETGKAIFDNLSPGTYTVEIPEITTGYKQLTEDECKETIEITENDLNKSYEFELEPAGKLQVTVKGDGEPISGALITITNKDDPNCVYSEQPTNANGQVELDELTPGRYVIYLEPVEGFKEPANNGVVVYVSQNGAKYEFLLAAEEPTVGKIIVNVKKDSSNGNGMDNVSVTVTSEDNSADTFTKKTENGGTVTFADLPQGDYNVKIEGQTGYTIASDNPQLANVIAGQDTTKEFILQQNGTIIIAVTSGGTGVEGVEVEVTPYPDSGEAKPYTTDENGNITIADVAPGDYTVTVNDKVGYTIVSENSKPISVTPGGESSADFTLQQNAELTVVVKDEKGAGVPGITVQAKKKNQYGYYADVVWESTTNESGSAECPAIVPGEYNISVKLENVSEYTYAGNSSKSMTLEPGANTAELVIAKTAALKIQVIDVTTTKLVNSPIKVSVTKDSSSVGDYRITGESSIPQIPRVSRGTYTAAFDISEIFTHSEYIYYNDLDASVKIDPYSEQEYVLQLYVAKKGSVNVRVEENGNPVNNQSVKLTILDKDGNELNYTVSGTTGREIDGETTLPNVPMGNYKVTIERNVGGVTRIETQYGTLSNPDVPDQIVFDLQTQDDPNQGKIRISVWNNKSPRESLNLVPVTITGPNNYHNQIASSIKGYVEVAGLEPGDYTVKVGGVDNYVRIDTEEDTRHVAESSTVTYDFVLDRRCTLEVEVLDKTTNLPVSGAKVKVSDLTGTTEILSAEETTANENIKVTKLKNGKYSVEIEEAPTGYAVYDVAYKEIDLNPYGPHSESEPHKVQFYLERYAEVQVTIIDDTTREAITQDVQMAAYYEGQEEGSPIVVEGGQCSIPNLTAGNYVTKLTVPNGYVLSSESESKTTVIDPDTIPEDGIYRVQFNVTRTTLTITVVDRDDNNNGVSGVEVLVPNAQGGTETKITDEDGEIVIEGLPFGDYSTKITVPSGYKLVDPTTTEQDATLSANNNSAELTYALCQVGALKVTITEKGTTNGVSGVQVAITTNVGGTEKTVYTPTNANGQVNLTGQEVGTYKISIPTSIAGYKELDAAYVVQTKDVEANKTTEYAFEVEKVTTADPNKGDAEIIVKDEVTGNPVPGASVIVTAPDNTKRKYTTDGNGVISMTQQEPGEYKIEVLEVPAGYTVTQNQQTTITVVAGSMVKTEIKVKPADSTGGAVNTGGTSNSTGDVVNTGGATDSNTGGVITTGQTDGATNNKTVDSQSVSKQPKTGDESNPGIIWIILSVSACLAAASAIGLIYVKKKED